MTQNLSPISEADLAEHWFSLRLKTWKGVAAAVKGSGHDQKSLADRIGMDPGQFNKVITGKKSNVTLRTLHNIARAVGHRLQITLVPLADLPKPNFDYEGARHDRYDRASFVRETSDDFSDRWMATRVLEPADAG